MPQTPLKGHDLHGQRTTDDKTNCLTPLAHTRRGVKSAPPPPKRMKPCPVCAISRDLANHTVAEELSPVVLWFQLLYLFQILLQPRVGIGIAVGKLKEIKKETHTAKWRTMICAYIVCTVEPLYCGHLEDLVKCPIQRGVLISGVNLY